MDKTGRGVTRGYYGSASYAGHAASVYTHTHTHTHTHPHTHTHIYIYTRTEYRFNHADQALQPV